MGIAGGPLGSLVAFIAAQILGSMLDKGLILVDIGIDQITQAMKDPQWRETIEKVYNQAHSSVKTEEEKIAIRQQYLDALSKYATYGNGVPDSDKNTKR